MNHYQRFAGTSLEVDRLGRLPIRRCQFLGFAIGDDGVNVVEAPVHAVHLELDAKVSITPRRGRAISKRRAVGLARDAVVVDGVGIFRLRRLGHLFLRVVDGSCRRDSRWRRRRLEVWGLLPDSRRIAHFLLPAVAPRAEQHGLWAGLV